MDEEAVARINGFLKKVGERYHLQQAILFGSRARGDHFQHSDVDLLLVSEDFAGIPFPDRPSPLYVYWNDDLPLEILCYTPEEFERKRQAIGIVRDAVQEGIHLIGRRKN